MQKLGAFSDAAASPWIQLFSSLYQAELSAGLFTGRLSEAFARDGDDNLARIYRAFSDEEHGHARAVMKLCPTQMPLDATTMRVYDGDLLSLHGKDRDIEILALIHVVFEPAAMAFFSQVLEVADEVFKSALAGELRATLEPILREEAGHIAQGKKIFFGKLAGCDAEVVRQIQRSLGRHRAFISAGVRRFFRGNAELRDLRASMLRRYADVLSRTSRNRFHGSSHQYV